MAYLLLRGELPNKSELDSFQQQLCFAREIPQSVISFLEEHVSHAHPMSMLRTAISLLGVTDEHAEASTLEEVNSQAVWLINMTARLVAAIHRIRKGKEILSPKPEWSFAKNICYQFSGITPTEEQSRAYDLLLILHAEHGFNASTFSARVIIATLTDIYSAITGAIGALKGKLHGGANTEVLKTLLQIGSVEGVAAWVEDMRAKKAKFMGFGHAVYKTADPRAEWLKVYSKKLGEQQNNTLWYDMSEEIERLVVPIINRNCNVDFYSASVQHYLGIPHDLFTCIFAASRVVGWSAHILEQLGDNKIIRPSANYVGYPERSYVALESR